VSMLTHAAALLALATGAALFTAPAQAEAGKPPALPETLVEAGAKKALQDMSDYLKAAKSYSFHAEVAYDDVLPSGQKIAFAASADLSLRRPNGIHAAQSSDTGARRLWYDGKTLTLFDPVKNTYAEEALTGNTDQALEHMINILHFTPPLSDFLHEDPARALGKQTRFGFEVGTSEVAGVACRHFAFVDKLIDWQIWIEDGKVPLPRKLVITYKTLPSSPQYAATLTDWDFTTRLPDTLFAARVPASAIRIPFMKTGQATPAPAAK